MARYETPPEPPMRPEEREQYERELAEVLEIYPESEAERSGLCFPDDPPSLEGGAA
jgi:hypothetical protein